MDASPSSVRAGPHFSESLPKSWENVPRTLTGWSGKWSAIVRDYNDDGTV